MNTDEIYRAWKERPVPLNISVDFADQVTRRVHRQAEKRQTLWKGPALFELLQRNRSLQFAALAVAATAGLSRFWLMFSIILAP